MNSAASERGAIPDGIAAQFSLSGRTAVITGAASGIGRETARVLAEAGAATVLGDIDEEGLGRTAAYVAEAGGAPARVRRTDVATRNDIDALAAFAKEGASSVDIWVNVAGIIVSRPMLETTEEDLERVLSVNLKGVYWGCVAAGKLMKDAGKGSIINMSSTGGESAVPGLSLYSMTKAGVNMVTRTCARELGPYGIRANAVAPGWVDTPMGTHSFRDATGNVDTERRAEGLRQRAAASPLGITGTPRDIALAVLYLASDASRFVTGQILRPNGGVLMP